ncbi:hypothetical protein BT96DRAFT_1022202 [Gymnopus androsaceus JB14]|uniref:Uncharacterized protein n=1 Tax=Gymnopus androsaceus JB14 TaxID=1447944 RepID=A0A6A4H9S4_9AGAR|nr:hypothetical protein BT96DRAFT_1022202 [Gymnopus androsaceus JB14]
MILDEKSLLNPPPPYFRHSNSNNPFLLNEDETGSDTASLFTIGSNNPYAAYLSARQSAKSKPSFSTLPSHLLLQIVYSTFPQEDGEFEGDAKAVLQRQTLYWLETSLRLVNRELYIASMHVLRCCYLSTYDSLIRPPYSSDPFPSSNSIPVYQPSSSRRNTPNGPSSSLFPQHRELQTLDLFIAVLAHEEQLLDTSTLYLARHEAYKDIFDLMQPRSRLEDLVAKEGIKTGVISMGDECSVPTTPITPQTPSEGKEKENSPYATSSSSSMAGSLYASTSTLAKPLKKSKSTFSIFSTLSSIGKGKGKAPVEQTPSRPTRTQVALTPLVFGSLSISFSPRKVSLMYAPPPSASSLSSLTVTGSSSTVYGGSTYGALGVSHNSRARKRSIVEVQRERDEALEVCARRLVRGLRKWMEEEAQ